MPPKCGAMTIAPNSAGPNRSQPIQVVAHTTMRTLIVSSSPVTAATDTLKQSRASRPFQYVKSYPELVIVDAPDFARYRCELLVGCPPCRLVVIGLEPGPAYRQAALNGGAGAWVSREDVADDRSPAAVEAVAAVEIRRTLTSAAATSSFPISLVHSLPRSFGIGS